MMKCWPSGATSNWKSLEVSYCDVPGIWKSARTGRIGAALRRVRRGASCRGRGRRSRGRQDASGRAMRRRGRFDGVRRRCGEWGVVRRPGRRPRGRPDSSEMKASVWCRARRLLPTGQTRCVEAARLCRRRHRRARPRAEPPSLRRFMSRDTVFKMVSRNRSSAPRRGPWGYRSPPGRQVCPSIRSGRLPDLPVSV
jgi:hypothetical protein